MLHKNKSQRLGNTGGADEILAHPWFTNVDNYVTNIENKRLHAPFLPTAGRQKNPGEVDPDASGVKDTWIGRGKRAAVLANSEKFKAFEGFD